jgi:hypothetical protein
VLTIGNASSRVNSFLGPRIPAFPGNFGLSAIPADFRFEFAHCRDTVLPPERPTLLVAFSASDAASHLLSNVITGLYAQQHKEGIWQANR